MERNGLRGDEGSLSPWGVLGGVGGWWGERPPCRAADSIPGCIGRGRGGNDGSTRFSEEKNPTLLFFVEKKQKT